MRKGINRIILGTILIVLQILSVIGNSYGDSTYQFNSLANLLAFMIGFLSPGICGTLSLVFGIKAYKSGETVSLILHDVRADTRILNYILGCLMLLLLLMGIISDLDSILTINGILYAYAAISLIVYSWFHQGKKPSSLYAASMVITGCVFILTPLLNWMNLYIILVSSNNAYLKMMTTICTLSQMACGATNIASGILIYRETFSTHLVKFLGIVSFILFFISKINTVFKGYIYIDFYSICYPLQLAILINTCFIPIHTNKHKRRR